MRSFSIVDVPNGTSTADRVARRADPGVLTMMTLLGKLDIRYQKT